MHLLHSFTLFTGIDLSIFQYLLHINHRHALRVGFCAPRLAQSLSGLFSNKIP